MNNIDLRQFPDSEAILEYLSSDVRIVKPGKYVRCAVTGEPIPLEDLKYWSAERQEAYSSPAAALKRHQQARGKS